MMTFVNISYKNQAHCYHRWTKWEINQNGSESGFKAKKIGRMKKTDVQIKDVQRKQTKEWEWLKSSV